MKEPSLYTSPKRLEGKELIEGYWDNEKDGAAACPQGRRRLDRM